MFQRYCWINVIAVFYMGFLSYNKLIFLFCSWVFIVIQDLSSSTDLPSHMSFSILLSLCWIGEPTAYVSWFMFFLDRAVWNCYMLYFRIVCLLLACSCGRSNNSVIIREMVELQMLQPAVILYVFSCSWLCRIVY